MYRSVLWILILMLSLTTACKKKTDGDTSATHKVSIPQAKGDFQILGEVPGIHNFVVRYSDDLYRGGMLDSLESTNALLEWNVRTIVSMSPSEAEKQAVERLGIKLIEIDMDKKTGVDRNIWQTYRQVLQEENYPLYVHCHGGSHRAGILAMLYRIHVLGWSREKAEKEYLDLGGDAEKDKALLRSVTQLKL